MTIQMEPTRAALASPTARVAEYIATARFEDLPTEVVAAAKWLILDGVANAIGGVALTPGRLQLELFEEFGGAPQATVLATGRRLPVTSAACLNAAFANLLDFDDTYKTLAHPGATAIPPAFAVGEYVGASGREVINAVVLGYEVPLRITWASLSTPERYRQVWGLSVWGTFGAVAAAAALLRLTPEQTRHALGLGGFNAPVPNMRKLGLELEERPFSWTKNNYGWAVMGGVLGALLARRGFRGNASILDGERGFWAMAGSDRCDPEKIVLGLGRDYWLPDTGFKPYACCRWTHTTLDAVRQLMAERPGLDPAAIERVEIATFFELSNNFAAGFPQNIVDAQFNLRHVVALELLGRSPARGLSEADLTDPTVRNLTERIHVRNDPEADRLYFEAGKMLARVRLVLRDGTALAAEEAVPWGNPGRPFT